MKNKLNALQYLVILGATLWSLPALADTTSTPQGTDEATPSTVSMETPTSTSEVVTPTSTIIIRYQDQIIWSGSIALTSTAYHDSINNADYQLTSSTVFSALVLTDEQSDNFNISDAQNGPYGFYLNCLHIITSSTPTNACANWNYVVNNTYPSVGMNDYSLTGGETIYIYFSSPWSITATTSTFPLGTTTTLQTWRYQYDNVTEPWVLDTNNILDIAVPNPTPTGWWDTTIVVTSTQTNASGTVDYNFSATGTYYINFNDFTKWSPLTITVLDPATTTTPEEPPTGGGSGGGSSNQTISQNTINETVHKLISFIKSKQEADGKIVDGGTSDWLAMTFAANNIYAADVKNGTASLFDYIYNYNNADLDNELNNCAAYPRHILALLASGVAKTDNKIVALKTKLDACVQTDNFGFPGINDDVFGLIAALAIGEDSNSLVVQTTVAALQANQQAGGGFAYPGPFESPDLTGVAINALKYAQNNGVTVDPAIFSNAKQYLKNQQLADGGWGYLTSDALTTGWAVMGINALGENQSNWFTSAGKNPWYVLTTLNTDHFTQSWDGNIDWFATKHAVPALLGKSWPIILSPTLQPQTSGSSGNSASSIASSPSTSTTPTSIIVTTTPSVATSTLSVLPTPTTTEELVFTMEDPDEFGQILGIKIKNTDDTKVVANSIPEKIISAPEEDVSMTSGSMPSQSEEDQNTNNKTEQNSNISDTDSTAHEWVKKLLLVCLLGAIAIGAYLGINKFLKK